MLFFKNGKWNICNEKVRYIQNGEEITQFVGAEGHDWWLEFEEKWEHTEIIEFIPFEHTEEQAKRLEEINSVRDAMVDGISEICIDYILNGTFPQVLEHQLKVLQNQKEKELLGISISEREINEIILGQQISAMEIQLLELQLGGNL